MYNEVVIFMEQYNRLSDEAKEQFKALFPFEISSTIPFDVSLATTYAIRPAQGIINLILKHCIEYDRNNITTIEEEQKSTPMPQRTTMHTPTSYKHDFYAYEEERIYNDVSTDYFSISVNTIF